MEDDLLLENSTGFEELVEPNPSLGSNSEDVLKLATETTEIGTRVRQASGRTQSPNRSLAPER
jgi:hypothetical protein